MNLETARIFCDLVEMKNFSRTAEVHGISQSAVSQQLAQLEMEHKVQLINRKKRPIELTAAGQVFYQACKDILERYDHLNSELAALKQSTCRIHLAAIFSIGMHTLQPYIQKFMSIYPDVNLSVEYYDAKEIYDKLLRGMIDIGVVAIPRRDRNIDMYPFENEPLVLACSPAHPLASNPRVDIHELQGEKFIAFTEGIPTRRYIDDILNRYRITVRYVMEFDNTETIKRAVEINAGVSILPSPTLRTELANGTLKTVEFTNESFYRPTGIIVRKDKSRSKAGQYLIELLRKE
jgi:DNA-binding transcriptional LysR family regulator